MNTPIDTRMEMTRRYFFQRAGLGIGGAALASLLSPDLLAEKK